MKKIAFIIGAFALASTISVDTKYKMPTSNFDLKPTLVRQAEINFGSPAYALDGCTCIKYAGHCIYVCAANR